MDVIVRMQAVKPGEHARRVREGLTGDIVHGRGEVGGFYLEYGERARFEARQGVWWRE